MTHKSNTYNARLSGSDNNVPRSFSTSLLDRDFSIEIFHTQSSIFRRSDTNRGCKMRNKWDFDFGNKHESSIMPNSFAKRMTENDSASPD